MTANDPPIPRQIRRDFRPLFVLRTPMLLSRWRFMRSVDEFRAVHRIMESTRGKIMHGRFVRWPPLHSADSPSPYNGPPRRFRPRTFNRKSNELVANATPAFPSQPLSSSRSDNLERDTGCAFINFYSDRTEYNFEIIFCIAREKDLIGSQSFDFNRMHWFSSSNISSHNRNEKEKRKKQRNYLSTFAFKKRNAIFQRNAFGAFALTHQQFRSLQTTTMPSTTTGMIPAQRQAQYLQEKRVFWLDGQYARACCTYFSHNFPSTHPRPQYAKLAEALETFRGT